MLRPLVLAAAVVVALGACRAAPKRVLTVFAAASLTDVAEALADSFMVRYPEVTVRVNAAASSLLARQIDEGAPADVFLSASEAWMDELVAAGRVAGRVHHPVGNRLVVAGPEHAGPLPDLAALARLGRVAVADPEAVPSGVYARQGLVCAGLWEAVAPRLMPALDVRAALHAVRLGAADAAIVYASDLRYAEGLHVILEWPLAAQPPIRYAAAAVAPSSRLSEAFVRYVSDPQRAALWTRYGFTLLTDEPARGACKR